MKLRWSFRAANDRGPQAESRVLFEAPRLGSFFEPHMKTLDKSRVFFVFIHNLIV